MKFFLRIILLFIFIFSLTLFLSTLSDFSKITSNQVIYNLIQSIHFFVVLLLVFALDKYFLNKNLNRFLKYLLKVIACLSLLLVGYHSQKLVENLLNVEIIQWPLYWVMIIPISYFVYSTFFSLPRKMVNE